MSAMPGAGFSFGKVITISLFIVFFAGLIMNVGKGIYLGVVEKSWGPLVDSTLGQALFWDEKIAQGFDSLKNEEFINNIPVEIRDEYQQFIVQTIIFYTLLFLITAYGLHKFGSWIMGEAAFNPTTDIVIWAVILLVFFPFAEFLYGYLMFNKLVVPYHGVIQLFMPSNWGLLMKDFSSVIAMNVTG
jgi:hypothetical protein